VATDNLYYYRIKAHNLQGDSIKSNTGSALFHEKQNVSGIISSNTLWTNSYSYIVTGSILVEYGAVLTIDAGTVVKFNSNVSIQIQGTFIARGTNENKIIFTSNQEVPSAGDWGYIFFSDSSTDASVDVNDDYVSGSILENCVIEYAGSLGEGALKIDSAHPYINANKISNNSASGIYSINLTNTLRIIDCEICNNTDTEYGGGIYTAGGTIIIDNNTICNNFAAKRGGGVWISSDSGEITNNLIIENQTAASQTYGGGGGIFASGGIVTITNNTINDNIASSSEYGGGGGICAKDCILYIEDNIFSGNYSSYGGAIQTDWGEVTVSGNKIVNNTAFHNEGGGIYGYSGIVNIENNIISNNYAFDNAGGIFIADWVSTTATITHNTIYKNSTSNEFTSSALYIKVSENDSLEYNTITNNFGKDSTVDFTIYIISNPLFNFNNIMNNDSVFLLGNGNNNGSPDLDATYNYWGTTTESIIQNGIYDWHDNVTLGFIDYGFFTTLPEISAPIAPPTEVIKTGNVQITWAANSESDLEGYKIYYGSPTGYSFDNVIDVGNVNTYTINGISISETFAITSYDEQADGFDDQIEGHESWYSIANEMP
jgi:hypothetical protein